MTANLEGDGFVVGVLHMPGHLQHVAFELVAHGQIEVTRVFGAGLLVVVQGEHYLLVTLGNELEVHVACKTVTSHVSVGVPKMSRAVPKGADNRKENGGVAAPVFRIGLPEILVALCVFNALQLCSVG